MCVLAAFSSSSSASRASLSSRFPGEQISSSPHRPQSIPLTSRCLPEIPLPFQGVYQNYTCKAQFSAWILFPLLLREKTEWGERERVVRSLSVRAASGVGRESTVPRRVFLGQLHLGLWVPFLHSSLWWRIRCKTRVPRELVPLPWFSYTPSREGILRRGTVCLDVR